ncbi:MAG: ATP-binding cassette domain-containing protein [Haloarculaceae archaeon]
MDVIRTEDLRYTYRGSEQPALDGLDFAVESGEVFGFLGPSGAGKTTTQKILTGLLDDYEGRVSVLGRPVDEWGPELYRRIGVSAETPSLYHKLTGRENLELFGSLYGGSVRDPLSLLDAVGIADAVDRRVGTYSKGMRMRLSVVRALLHDPELVFLDEPTGGIDPSNARDVMEVVEGLREDGTTVFLTTHDMSVADRLCDRVAFIVDGALPVVDTPRELKLAHGRPRVRVEYQDDGAVATREFPLSDLADDEAFQALLASGRVETIHTEEATLADVFIAVTGEALR